MPHDGAVGPPPYIGKGPPNGSSGPADILYIVHQYFLIKSCPMHRRRLGKILVVACVYVPSSPFFVHSVPPLEAVPRSSSVGSVVCFLVTQ